MKILHTADWHLGKYLDKFSRLEEQQEILEQIVQIAEKEAVDIVIVAGDLFDSFNPSNEASELLYKTLHRLADGGNRAVVAIAGNHDSPERIDMPDTLARECGILFVGFPVAETKPFATQAGVRTLRLDKGFVEIKLPGFEYPLRMILTPYANEIRLRRYLGSDDKEENLRQVLQNHWLALANKYCDQLGVNILMTHLFVMQKGGEIQDEPEGEKAILVGGSQPIFTENIPAQIQYVSLGHLHRFQDLGVPSQPVVYSGSPLSYSFAEAGQKKYVVLLNAEPAKNVILEKIELNQKRPLLQNKFENVEDALLWLKDFPEAYVQLTLKVDKYLSASDNSRLRMAHDRIVSIIPEISNQEQTADRQMLNINEHSMEQLFEKFFFERKGQEPNLALQELFREVLHSNEQESE
ncbi:MAG: metallophosphoesterase family protein [Saprospiraceae bacterium]